MAFRACTYRQTDGQTDRQMHRIVKTEGPSIWLSMSCCGNAYVNMWNVSVSFIISNKWELDGIVKIKKYSMACQHGCHPAHV